MAFALPFCHLALACSGSVLPKACLVALPGALTCGVVKYFQMQHMNSVNSKTKDWEVSSSAFTAFTGLLGILIVFRTSQAYSRYWEGVTLVQQITGNFFDAASSVVAFTIMSKATKERIAEFRQTIASLTSLLTACCFSELLDESEHELLERMEVMGWWNFDEQTRSAVQKSTKKAHHVFFWWQSYVIEMVGQDVLNVPPPILARTFAEMGSGLSNFENASKLTNVPMPFHYSQISTWLLLIHWVLTPLCVLSWTKRPSLAFLFTFVLIFVFWALYLTSEELEDPFGVDEADVDLVEMQRYSNECLMMLLSDGAIRTARFNKSNMEGNGTMECAGANHIYYGLVASSDSESEPLQNQNGHSTKSRKGKKGGRNLKEGP